MLNLAFAHLVIIHSHIFEERKFTQDKKKNGDREREKKNGKECIGRWFACYGCSLCSNFSTTCFKYIFYLVPICVCACYIFFGILGSLLVSLFQCIYGCYVHSAILPTFHRRCYWLLQVLLLPTQIISQGFLFYRIICTLISFHFICVANDFISNHLYSVASCIANTLLLPVSPFHSTSDVAIGMPPSESWYCFGSLFKCAVSGW